VDIIAVKGIGNNPLFFFVYLCAQTINKSINHLNKETMAIILKNAPKTEEGRKLQLTKEQEDMYKFVFRINKEKQCLELYDFWNPEEMYDNKFVIMPLTSTCDGVVYMPANTIVRNVIGSSSDRAYGGVQWIKLIEIAYSVCQIHENPYTCCLDGYIYNPNTGEGQLLSSHKPQGNALGGHMVLYGDNQKLPKGANFYLLHICYGHNNTAYDSFCFRVENGTYALVMRNFLQTQPLFISTIIDLSSKSNTTEDIGFDVKKFCEEYNIHFNGMIFE
jgi:hypothetical protein